MNAIESIPFELRLALLFLVGAFLGSLANWATYRLAWHQRRIGPWILAEPDAPPRAFADRIPIFGWLGLRRESSIHGITFWIRPMLVELAAAFGLAWLYWWEIDQLALFPLGTPHPAPAEWLGLLHIQFTLHVVLFWLMLVATLIDADEKTIPDTITLPGTLVALLAAAIFPNSLLPGLSVPVGVRMPDYFWALVSLEQWPFLTLASPNAMPKFLLVGCTIALAIALGCWWLWCVGLMRRDWYPRHGLRRAMTILFARLKRSRSTYGLLLLGLIGTIGIAVVWSGAFAFDLDAPAPETASLARSPATGLITPVAGDGANLDGGSTSAHWLGLITALVGMAAAGGLVWVIRLIGAAVLHREAMGFGDVTLMAMIGAFLGWQASMLTFFLAVLIAVFVGLAMWFLHRENEIPFGPFLCTAAAVVLIFWADIWSWANLYFELGMLVPIVIVACLALMPIMLMILQIIKRLLASRGKR